ncbi:hypothetical protein [Candidatus Nitrosocosmicus franklandus]|uniref:Uncharacterized protein n=1 Tax=Candidatus Nitrosocosmicus franklandianus TaxID=1798806 RepID=A0A484I762_9ARCH|nr:hypothetical protein [Candidatus Nitrosocosmicus franklandus]VFJ12946.1 conserved protein of unknown function [Candidatus Nitrosocosmicus franklandus]
MYNAEVLIYPSNSFPMGKSFNDWCILWWKWLLTIEKSNNPAYDMTGKKAYINQSDPDVFFLCQTFEKSRIFPHRRIEILHKKKIFLPILNWISFRDEENQSEETLKSEAADKMNKIGMLEFYVNGKPVRDRLPEFRVRTPLFEVNLPNDNILGVKQGLTTVVSDGYWLFLESNLNKINISSLGSCSSGITEIGVNYQIIFTD